MPGKPSHLLNRISRIFNHKNAAISQTTLSVVTLSTESSSTDYDNDSSFTHYNSSLHILLQRAPSSKLLVEDDIDISAIEYSYSCSDIHTAALTTADDEFSNSNYNNTNKAHNNYRQSWVSTLSKLTPLNNNRRKSTIKRKSNKCWFIPQSPLQQEQLQQQGSSFYSTETSDQQQQPNKIKESKKQVVVVDRHILYSPLSITSSLNSSATTTATRSDTARFSSFCLPITENDDSSSPSTARTSIDSQLFVLGKEKENSVAKKKSTFNLAGNVQNILGDAILLADQELDI